MQKNKILYLLTLTFCVLTKIQLAQFAGAVGTIGTSAIHKDSSVFIDWASSCQITRGLQDIAISNSGYTTVGDSTSSIGFAGTNGIVSLGDGGVAILTFTNPITNGNGFDFAVFENSFSNDFLELALVEVSSDGFNFFEFPATSNTDTTSQTGTFGLLDPTKINNLAGKYRANYGTPFNLDEVPTNVLLNKQYITHVKIRDVVGSIQNAYCSRDANGNKINDPYPTAYPSGGFDLDAVGVINNQLTIGLNKEDLTSNHFFIYPNPTANELFIKNTVNAMCHFSLINLLGNVVIEKKSNLSTETLNLVDLPKGLYTLHIKTAEFLFSKKIIKE